MTKNKLLRMHNVGIVVESLDGEYSLVKIIVSDILYVEGLKDYIKIHLATSERPVMTRMSLKAVTEKLPSNTFVRIHKSFIVCAPKSDFDKKGFCANRQTGNPHWRIV